METETHWREFLKEAERARLVELDLARADNQAERKRIWDRCRKRRAARAKASTTIS